MKLQKVTEILNATVLNDCAAQPCLQQHEIYAVCGSDLMSDVLAFVKTQGLLLTGLTNPQVIRTAETMDMKAVCFVRGKVPDGGVIDLARRHDIVVMSSGYTMYTACGLLYSNGLSDMEDA